MKSHNRTSLSYPQVVGTVHSADSLKLASRIRAADCDWLELRVDGFLPGLDRFRRAAAKLRLPRIVTVRHPSEGGMAPGITAGERRALYGDFLELAGMIDIELRWAGALREVIREARDAGVGVILSHHDFRRTPPEGRLRALARQARDAGGDVFKVAAVTAEERDVATLIGFLADEKGQGALSVMGMGSYGKVSRLVLAQAGSCLNYGYLGKANASGQWPAAALKGLIAQLTGGQNQEAAGAAAAPAGALRTRMTAE